MLLFELHSLGADFVMPRYLLFFMISVFCLFGVVSLRTLVGFFCLGTRGISTFMNHALRA